MKTVRAFDVEAIEEGDITARLCLLCYNSRTVHHLDPSLAVKGRWAVTNHDDSGGPRHACDAHLVDTMRNWTLT